MKNIFLRPSVLFSCFVVGVALTALVASHFSFAQEEIPDEGIPENVILRALPNGAPYASCVDNYQSWDHSNQFDADGPNFLQFLPSEGYQEYTGQREFFLNVNNDNLLDYMYISKQIYDWGVETEECIFTNTGSGWEAHYRCVIKIVNNQYAYYGDCALTE